MNTYQRPDYERFDTVKAVINSKSRKATYLSIVNDKNQVVCPAICFQPLNLANGSVIEASIKRIPEDETRDIVVSFDRTIFDAMYDSLPVQ